MTEVSHYDYDLPKHLIAQEPLARRSDARLMVTDRQTQTVSHRYIRDLPELLQPKDLLVLNDSRVVPARLIGQRTATGGRWEGLFLSADEQGQWRVLGKTRGRIAPGETVTLLNRRAAEEFRIRLLSREPEGVWVARPEPLRPEPAADTWQLLDRVGRVPLPHYIRQGHMVDSDVARYQTVFAREPGSVAAPTAGLHFTEDLLGKVQAAGVQVAKVTLHVGIGTFRPIATASLEEHVMHTEWASVSAEACEAINNCRASGGRVITVGTTAMRTLESAARATNFHRHQTGASLMSWQGETDLFIRPGHDFRVVDGLLTNFHLPRSTLLVLVRTFGGDELLQRAYAEAIREEYRFFSYGDAMLIV